MSSSEDHDMLIELRSDVKSIQVAIEKIEKAINGNGHPGIKQDITQLMSRVTILETSVDEEAKHSHSVLSWISIIISAIAAASACIIPFVINKN